MKHHWVEREKIGIPEYDGAMSFRDLKEHRLTQHNANTDGNLSIKQKIECESCLHAGEQRSSVGHFLRCPYCRVSCDCYSMYQHIEFEHACKICHKCYAPEAMTHHLENSHFCQICKTYTNSLDSHKLTPHTCPLCGDDDEQTESNYATILNHMDKSHRCEDCLKYFPVEMLANHRKLDHHCQFCYQYFSAVNLEKHGSTVHPCPYCSEDFAYYKLSAHVDDANKCQYCGECYSREQVKLHLDQEHRCKVCGVIFPSKDTFRLHISSEHACQYCRDIIKYDSFEHHMDLKHRFSDSQCFECPLCKTFSGNKDQVFAHVNLKHVYIGLKPISYFDIEKMASAFRTQVLQCDQCFQLFNTKCEWNFHCKILSCNDQKAEKVKCVNCEIDFDPGTNGNSRNATIQNIRTHEVERGHCAFDVSCTELFVNPAKHVERREQANESTCIKLHRVLTQPYTCQYCKESFDELKKLIHHKDAKHTWPCQHCPMNFSFVHKINQHINSIHMCMKCGAEVVKKDYHKCDKLQQIKLNEEKKEQRTLPSASPLIKCSFCFEMVLFNTIANHILVNHKCPLCDTYHKELEEHIRIKHRCYSCSCDVSDIFMHIYSEHVCCHCGGQFKDKHHLRWHISSTHLCFDCCKNVTLVGTHLAASFHENDVCTKEESFQCAQCHCYFPESLVISCRDMGSIPVHVCAFCVEVLSRLSSEVELGTRCEYTDCNVYIKGVGPAEHKRSDHKCSQCPKFFLCKEMLVTHVITKHSLLKKALLAEKNSEILPAKAKRFKCVQKCILDGNEPETNGSFSQEYIPTWNSFPEESVVERSSTALSKSTEHATFPKPAAHHALRRPEDQAICKPNESPAPLKPATALLKLTEHSTLPKPTVPNALPKPAEHQALSKPAGCSAFTKPVKCVSKLATP